MASGMYNKGKERLLAEVVWGTSDLRWLLLDDTYTFSPDQNYVSDVSADEFDERFLLPALSPHLRMERENGLVWVLFGAERIPYISLEGCVNMAGGQPFSMANLRELNAYCAEHRIPIMLDATRTIENAWFIRQREPGYAGKSVREILREICDLTDGCTMSAKKDLLVNIGGFFACNDEETFLKAQNMVVVYEGLHTYGGLAGRDMEAMAQGIREAATEEHQAARIGQVRYLGTKLRQFGVPIVRPIGSHAIFLDAKAFLPQLDQDLFPAQTLAAELYLDAGIRAMERGNVSAGRDPETGQNRRPALELVRLTLPRRVYTQAHMDVVAESVARVHDRRDSIRGLKLVYEPEYLRFFQARFEPVE